MIRLFGCCDGARSSRSSRQPGAGARREGFLGRPPRIQHVGHVVPATEVAGLRTSLDERGPTQYMALNSARPKSLHDASADAGRRHRDPCREPGTPRFFSMVSGAAEGWDGWFPCDGSRLIAAFQLAAPAATDGEEAAATGPASRVVDALGPIYGLGASRPRSSLRPRLRPSSSLVGHREVGG